MSVPNYILIGFTLLIITIFSSCKDCPPDERIGKILLEDSSRLFLAHSQPATLTFVDSLGNKKIFNKVVNSENNNVVRLVIDRPCSEGHFDKQEIFYEGESRSVEYKNNSDYIRYGLSTNLIPQEAVIEERDLFYDNFLISGVFAQFSVITSLRGQEHLIDQNWITNMNRFQFVQDTIFFQRNFEEVYYRKYESKSILFSTNVGVVGFFDGQKLWVSEQ